MMKSRTLVVVTACLIAIAAVAGSAQAQTTITVAYRATEGPWLEWVQEEFHKRYPDIRIELLPGLGGWETVEVLGTWWLGNSFPDVFFGTGGDVQKYIYYGWTADLTDYIQRDAAEIDLDDFLPGTIEVWEVNGRIYGLPIGVSGQTILYNRDLLAQAGLVDPPYSWDTDEWTWDEWIDYARKATKRDGEGKASQFGTTLRSGGVQIDINWIFGGDFLTPESYLPGAKWESALYSPENIRAYEAVLNAFYVDRVAPDPVSGAEQWSNGVAGSLLSVGLAMDWTGWWALTSIVRADNTLYEFGIAPPPKVVTRNSTLFNDPWCMSSKTQHPEEAWTFIKFATSPESLAKYGEYQGMPPARHSSFIEGFVPAFSEKLGIPGNVLMEAFMGSVLHGRSRYEAADMGVEPFITPYLVEIVSREVPIESGLEQAHEHLNRFLAEQQEAFGQL